MPRLPSAELEKLLTDFKALENLANERWRELSANSPNLTTTKATLRLIDASGGDARAVRRLLAIAGAPQGAAQ